MTSQQVIDKYFPQATRNEKAILIKAYLYVKMYGAYAKQVEKEFGVPQLFSLGQSALENGYGATVVGNMMFGVKDTDGVNGNEQLITTTEYHNSPNVKYPVVMSLVEVLKGKRWKYKVKDWFRKYPTPYDSFRDHAFFLQRNKRYREALTYKYLPYRFAEEVCKAGYATAPNYWRSLKSVMGRIESVINL